MQTGTIKDAQTKSFANSMTLLIFTATLFLSACIMFAVQPMIGKMLLPIVGGSPAGWIIAMAFFQVMLLAGYFAAHLLSKTGKVTQGIVYLVLLSLGIAFMPLDLTGHIGKISANPGPFDVFLLLTFAVAVPFIALSATSSTIQRLFTASDHPDAKDPYFLYAASNLGSFSGLLLYPLLAEPLIGLHAQAQALFGVYLALITFALFCLLISARKSNREETAPLSTAPAAVTGSAPAAKKWLTWLFLSFVPSSLLMAVTVYITTDIISAPMIWALPLALYLMTFVIAFSRKPVISLRTIEWLHPPAIITALVVMFSFDKYSLSWTGMVLFLAIFTIAALACHMRLASMRPLEENSKSLTAFYLMMSIGGALGGVLNAFVIPVITNRLVELPLMLIASLLLHPYIKKSKISFYLILVCIFTTLAFIHSDFQILPWNIKKVVWMTYAACLSLCLFSLIKNPKAAVNPFTVFACGAAIIMPLTLFAKQRDDILLMTRNFYGSLRVFERDVSVDGTQQTKRFIRHGTTVHGIQFTSPALQNILTAYYSEDGPLGDVFRLFPYEHTALVGLGVGTINCYNKGTTPFTFIEIDPAVVYAARNYFKYLSDCNKDAPPKIMIGDGRIELSKLPEGSLDIIVLDAFSSDTIPTHLLTVDALKEYSGKLKDNGIIAFNLSNRYFNLLKIMGVNANAAGLKAYWKLTDPEDKTYSYSSLWMVIGKNQESLQPLKNHGWAEEGVTEHLRPWTDDYTNLMGMLEFKL